MGHGVGFALHLIGVVDPVSSFEEGAAGVSGGLKVLHVGLEKRKFLFGERGVFACFFVPKEREGFTPIALAGEEPVTEFVLNLAGAFAFAVEPVDDFCFGFGSRKPVEEAGVGCGAVSGEALPVFVTFWLDDLCDGELKLLSEFKVALIVSCLLYTSPSPRDRG